MPTHTDPERLSAVHRYHILDAPADGSFDSVARVAAQVFGTPIATVTIVDVDRVWFAACHGLSGVTQIGTEPGLCASAVLQDEAYVVNDGAVDPRTLDHPLVRGELGLRFYAAAPIITGDGHRLGTVNVIDREPREVTETQVATLTALAGIVADQLELRLAAIQAVRAERGLDEASGARATASAKLAGQLRHLAADHLDAEHPRTCQLGLSSPCDNPVEVKVADPWGDSAWGCIRHAEDVIINERSTFIADQKLNGLERYLRPAKRRTAETARTP
ncbi:GAF domain-containing protein [Saccharothrix carnea]|uniref:GAF domain-containing protein n=1 Tax=Saccharothrix carnea TaxID=1280637 RepID=A0A2P8I2M2_SACCR|nr:GAF domain-containing protein [Saccharothrix carnea]PSL52718.1 GAF domain-containing protein [Saccharothrix carnea]